jgi:hypothetical protein
MRARLFLAAAVLVTACGSTTPAGETPWAPSHPDPQGVHFAGVQGVCRLTVRYPNDAPGEIDVAAAAFVQRDRIASLPAGVTKLATSADWTLYRDGQHLLVLVTPGGNYEYRDGAKCGSDIAPPT